MDDKLSQFYIGKGKGMSVLIKSAEMSQSND